MRRMFQVFFALTLSVLVLPAHSAQDAIKIAVVGAMSGSLEKLGTQFKQGAQGALDAINAEGGLLGRTVSFVVKDDECNPELAVKAAKEVVAEKIPFVMGHLCSAASIAASEIYEKAGIVQISPSSTSPAYTERGLKNVFRTTGRDDMQGFVLAEHIIRTFKNKKVGIVYDDSVYARGVAEVTKSFLNKSGIEDAFYLKAPGKPFDFSGVIDAIKKAGVHVLLYPGLPEPVTAFVRQAREAKTRVKVVGSDSYSGIKFDKQNKRWFDGHQFSFPPDPADDRRNKALAKQYKAKGHNPEAFTFYSYGAAEVWGLAVKAAGSLAADKVGAALRSQEFDTVLGRIKFDAKGDISNPGFVMYFFNKGKRHYFY